MVPTKTLILSAGLAAMTIPARAAGDAKNGEQIFNQCKPCHSLEAGKNGIGPTLHGLLGRKAGTVPGYSYSAAMQSSGIVWNEDTLAKFLADPSTFVPGTKMVSAGIRDKAQLDDLIAYLKEATQ
jgi:cytochrome c2